MALPSAAILITQAPSMAKGAILEDMWPSLHFPFDALWPPLHRQKNSHLSIVTRHLLDTVARLACGVHARDLGL